MKTKTIETRGKKVLLIEKTDDNHVCEILNRYKADKIALYSGYKYIASISIGNGLVQIFDVETVKNIEDSNTLAVFVNYI